MLHHNFIQKKMKTKPTPPTAETFTLNRLATLTGRDRRTLARRLPGKGPWPLAEILAAHESHGASISEALDLAQERAALAAEQRRKLQRENDLAEGRTRPTLPADEVRAAARAFGEAWQVFANAAASAATGRLLVAVQAGRPGEARDAIAEGLMDAMISALAVFGERLPEPLRAGMADGMAERAGDYPLREILEARRGMIEGVAGLREADLHPSPPE